MRLLWGSLPNFRERLLPRPADVEMTCGREVSGDASRPLPVPQVQIAATRRSELAQSGLVLLVLLALLVPSSVMAAVVLDELLGGLLEVIF